MRKLAPDLARDDDVALGARRVGHAAPSLEPNKPRASFKKEAPVAGDRRGLFAIAHQSDALAPDAFKRARQRELVARTAS